MQENDAPDETEQGKSNLGYQLLGTFTGTLFALFLFSASSPIPWYVAIIIWLVGLGLAVQRFTQSNNLFWATAGGSVMGVILILLVVRDITPGIRLTMLGIWISILILFIWQTVRSNPAATERRATEK